MDGVGLISRRTEWSGTGSGRSEGASGQLSSGAAAGDSVPRRGEPVAQIGDQTLPWGSALELSRAMKCMSDDCQLDTNILVYANAATTRTGRPGTGARLGPYCTP